MITAKKCNCCGKLYESYTNTRMLRTGVNGIAFANIDESGRYISGYTVDCCPECLESIVNHINSLRGR